MILAVSVRPPGFQENGEKVAFFTSQKERMPRARAVSCARRSSHELIASLPLVVSAGESNGEASQSLVWEREETAWNREWAEPFYSGIKKSTRKEKSKIIPAPTQI